MRFYYFIKVVPTNYYKADGSLLRTYQYSYTLQASPVNFDVPVLTTQPGTSSSSAWGEVALIICTSGIFFRFDFSPYEVTVTEKPSSFSQFLIHCFAIVGGVFVVMGLVSSVLSSMAAPTNKR